MLCIACVLVGYDFFINRKPQTHVYDTASGDKILIELDTKNDYALDSELPFTIRCGNDIVSIGSFITVDEYNIYKNSCDTDLNATILEMSETKNGDEYIFWIYSDDQYTEFNHALLLKECNTGIILTNSISQESANDIFHRLTFRSQ